MDVLHKFNWIRLISRMFEAMAGNFAYPEDIQERVNYFKPSAFDKTNNKDKGNSSIQGFWLKMYEL